MAHGALIGARGNSGTILAQLLRGMADVFGAPADRADRPNCCARPSVGQPNRRTGRSPTRCRAPCSQLPAAAATAAAADRGPGSAAVARAAYTGACTALDATPGQLAVLGRAGVVDAGGRGLVDVLAALVGALSGEVQALVAAAGRPGAAAASHRTTARPTAVRPSR